MMSKIIPLKTMDTVDPVMDSAHVHSECARFTEKKKLFYVMYRINFYMGSLYTPFMTSFVEFIEAGTNTIYI